MNQEVNFMVIQHNIAAINSYRNLGINQSGLNKNLEKLSSGYRINRAGDDAAGLAISEAMRSQINGLNQAAKNAQDAVGLIQTVEGALTETHSMLQRLTTLASQSANGTYNSVARANLQSEVDQLLDEIDRIANYTDFNGIRPIRATGIDKKDKDGNNINPKVADIDIVTSDETSYVKVNVNGAQSANQEISKVGTGEKRTDTTNLVSGKMTFQIGPSKKEVIEVTTQSMTSSGIGVHILHSNNNKNKRNDVINVNGDKKLQKTEGMITNQRTANSAIQIINAAIDIVSGYRAKLGAAQNRLEHTINNLKVTSENITAAESRIRDTDMADEITAFTKNNILLQASQSMLSQANSVPQSVLSLLG